MNKIIVGLFGLVLMASFVVGCKLTPDQYTTIANEAGLFSIVGWIAADNPDQETKKNVAIVLDVINDNASKVEAGKTYVEVVYPEVAKVIDAKVEERYRPLCKAAVMSLLGQLDLFFVAHPEWKKDQTIAINITKAFVAGAKKGLLLSDTDPIIVQAKKNTASMNALKIKK